MIVVICPHCGAKNNHRESSIGSSIKCKLCNCMYLISRPPGCLAIFGQIFSIFNILSVFSFSKLNKSERKIAETLLLFILFIMIPICCGIPFVKNLPSDDKKEMTQQQPLLIVKKEIPKFIPIDPAITIKKEVIVPKIEPEPIPSFVPKMEIKKPEVKIVPKVDNEEEYKLVEEQMIAYEIAKVEYSGWTQLKIGYKFHQEGEDATSYGNVDKGYKLISLAKEWYREVMRKYPGSEAAKDAKILVSGKMIALRSSPLFPVLPAGIKAKESEIFQVTFPDRIQIREYVRIDGTHVAAHFHKTKKPS